MSEDFKVLILPGELNNTPHGEDLVLVITQDEFLRMWRRGEAMLRNRKLKGCSIDTDYTGSTRLS
jgi:hypothetical protein